MLRKSAIPSLGSAARVRFLKPRFALPRSRPSRGSVTTTSHVAPLTRLSPLHGIGEYRFSNPLLESSASRAGLLGSAPPDRLPKSSGGGSPFLKHASLRWFARVRFLQRLSRLSFPQSASSGLFETAARVRFLKCVTRVRFPTCLWGWVSTAWLAGLPGYR